MAILRLIRFPNLLIVAFTQYLLLFVALDPFFRSAGIDRALDNFHFFLLVVSTISITISGYIINDIFDYELDLVNKPDKVIINRSISENNARKLYHLNNLLGFLISLYLAIHIKNIHLVLIYPAAILLLFYYSKALKKRAFWGNFIVAAFCAFVAGIVLFAERKGFMSLPSNEFQMVKTIFSAYFIFAFLSTIFREIIKDIEDFKGDMQNNCETLPIKYGIPFAKSIALFFGIFLLALIIWWMFLQLSLFKSEKLAFAVLILNLLPTLVCIAVLRKAQTKDHFSMLSKLAKYIMVSGLLYLLFLL